MNKKPVDETIRTESIVAARNGEPFVSLHWYEHSGQFTPTEARQFALTVPAAADAAESDAFLFGFCKKVGMPEDAQARLIMAFRNYRAEQFEKENPA